MVGKAGSRFTAKPSSSRSLQGRISDKILGRNLIIRERNQVKQLLLILSFAVTLAGCDRNEIKLANKGSRHWQAIQIKAGGHAFEIKELKGGAVETLRFQSRAEDGGQVTGQLAGEEHQAEFGYFTPNLSTQHEIVFMDNGTITIDDVGARSFE